MEELDLTDEDEYWDLISVLLDAAIAAPAASYAGTSPPDRATKHPIIKHLEMWAFKVKLARYSFPVYFKFCLKEHPRTSEKILSCRLPPRPQAQKVKLRRL